MIYGRVTTLSTRRGTRVWTGSGLPVHCPGSVTRRGTSKLGSKLHWPVEYVFKIVHIYVHPFSWFSIGTRSPSKSNTYIFP